MWFSTLSKCCQNVEKVTSPSPDKDRRPSLPYFMNAAQASARKNFADPIPTTPKDQLNFLKEITGQGVNLSEKDDSDPAKQLFVDIDNDKSTSKHTKEIELSSPDSTPRSVTKLNCMADGESQSQPDKVESVKFPDVKQTTKRIHHFIKSNVDLESDQDCIDEVMSFHDESIDSSVISANLSEVYSTSPLRATNLLTSDNPKVNFDMNAMQRALTNERDEHERLLSRSHHKTDHAVHSSQSFASVQTGYSRSSSYRAMFDMDDDLLKPDDNFATANWDE